MSLRLIGVLLFAASLCSADFGTPTGCHGEATSGTSINCSLAGAPAALSVTVVGVMTFTGAATVTVADGVSNNYTACGSNPSNVNDATAGTYFCFWRIGSGDASITATVGGITCAYCSITVLNSVVTGGTASKDTDAAGNGAGAPNLNTPTLTPAGSHELFVGFCASEANCDSVIAPWTLGPSGAGGANEEAEYILDQSSAQAMAFTTIDRWDTIAIAFSFTPSGGGTTHTRTLMRIGK